MGSSEVLVYRDPLPGLRHAERKNTAANECNSAAKSEWGHWDFRVQEKPVVTFASNPKAPPTGEMNTNEWRPKPRFSTYRCVGTIRATETPAHAIEGIDAVRDAATRPFPATRLIDPNKPPRAA